MVFLDSFDKYIFSISREDVEISSETLVRFREVCDGFYEEYELSQILMLIGIIYRDEREERDSFCTSKITRIVERKIPFCT
jgi:hypothetical protein